MTPVYTHFLWTYFGLSFQFHSNERTNSPVADIIRLDSQERYIPTYVLEPARKIWSEVAISQRNPSVIKSSSPLYLYIVYPYSLSLSLSVRLTLICICICIFYRISSLIPSSDVQLATLAEELQQSAWKRRRISIFQHRVDLSIGVSLNYLLFVSRGFIPRVRVCY